MPKGIYLHKPASEETKKKMSKARKGKLNIMWGKHHSEKTKRKISISKKGCKVWNKGKRLPPLSEEVRKKIGKSLKNSEKYKQAIKNPERSKKLSLLRKGKKRPPFSKKWRENLSKAISKENHPNWQGGKSFEPYTTDWTITLKRAIRERDNYICQKCNQYGNVVHHIDYDKKNCEPDNLITLCRKCNAKVNFDRNYWERIFSILILTKYHKRRELLLIKR